MSSNYEIQTAEKNFKTYRGNRELKQKDRLNLNKSFSVTDPEGLFLF